MSCHSPLIVKAMTVKNSLKLTKPSETETMRRDQFEQLAFEPFFSRSNALNANEQNLLAYRRLTRMSKKHRGRFLLFPVERTVDRFRRIVFDRAFLSNREDEQTLSTSKWTNPMDILGENLWRRIDRDCRSSENDWLWCHSCTCWAENFVELISISTCRSANSFLLPDFGVRFPIVGWPCSSLTGEMSEGPFDGCFCSFSSSRRRTALRIERLYRSRTDVVPNAKWLRIGTRKDHRCHRTKAIK